MRLFAAIPRSPNSRTSPVVAFVHANIKAWIAEKCLLTVSTIYSPKTGVPTAKKAL
jgi:hypothetical protein